jgi:ketosteroid isomerase-like protein
MESHHLPGADGRIAADYRGLRSIRALVPIRSWRDTGRAMSRENVEIVRRIWDAADRRDTQAVLSLYDSEVDLDVSGFPVVATDASRYRGHEGLRRLFAEWREIWDDADSQLVELIDAGERVVSVYNYRGRGRASGVSVEGVFATVWTIRDEKAVRVEWFVGRDEALEAVGLRE